MALTYTPKTEIGQKLPAFSLTTVEGKKWSSDEILPAPAKVVVFMCNHCPYVKAIESRLITLAAELHRQGVPGFLRGDAAPGARKDIPVPVPVR